MSARRSEPISESREPDRDGASPAHPLDRFAVPLALLALYVIWGSTYLAIRIAVVSFPPFLMAGVRFLLAGCLLYTILRARGAANPTRAQWRGSATVGGFLLLGGMGGVAFAEQWVASGLAATMIATTPLWTALFAGLWGRWPTRLEAAGLGVGFAGVVLLNLEGNLRANPEGAIILLLAPALWAFGSVWSARLSLPSGMMASAAEMLTGGVLLLLAGLLTGQRMEHMPTLSSLEATAYLLIFGSLVAFSAYGYLLRRVRPALATSYAYVNPVVAVGLGIGMAGERISGIGVVALAIILAGVGLVMLGRDRT